jgi:hypothetical protein
MDLGPRRRLLSASAARAGSRGGRRGGWGEGGCALGAGAS